MARKAGIDANGFFMLGLSPDTEETMKDTINYARTLPLDMLKFGITIGFPGTKMFKEYREKKLVRSYNWDDYFIYSTAPLFSHPNLTYEKVLEYMDLAYKTAILKNPGFIFRRLWRGIRTLEFFWDAYYFIRFFASPTINAETNKAQYFARDKWPTYDFRNKPITFYPVRPANNRPTEESLQISVI
jgi:anaerobic magnesium-protoporphyrin IX monomethyl ester cyclase